MALTVNHPLFEDSISFQTSSIGTSPVAAYGRAPFRGKITKCAIIQSGAVTGTTTVAVAINGTAVTGGSITVTGGAAGTAFTSTPTGANNVVEDDVISFTPSGGTGAGVLGFCSVNIKAG